MLVVGDERGFPFSTLSTPALTSLFAAIDAGRPVHLVVPNPDLIYPGGGGFGFAAGTIAQMFEGALALRYPHRTDLRFVRLGKPNTPIFEDAIRRSARRAWSWSATRSRPISPERAPPASTRCGSRPA